MLQGKRRHITSTSNLMSSLEELLNKENLIDIEEVNKAQNLEKKMEMIVQAILNVNNKFSTVHDMFNEANDGIDPRTSDCEDKLATLAEENKQLRFELDLVKGMHSKLEFENASLKAKVTALTAQQMKNNLTFAGLINDEANEIPIDVVSDFLTEKMHLDFPKSQVISARRIGFPTMNKPRLMVAELHPDLKQLILSNVKALKGVHNENGKPYSIFKQLLDQWAEERRQVQEAVKKARNENDKKPETQEKDIIEVKKGKLYINKKEQKLQTLRAPRAADVFVDKQEQDKIDKIKMKNSTPIEEKDSRFTAFATKLQSIHEVRRAYVKMRQLYPSAAHIMAAYVLKNSNEGHQDDQEHGSSVKILKTLKDQSVNNMAVFVVL